MAFSIEDLQKYSKDQLEQATGAATTLTKGVQEIAAEAADYSKKALEESTAMVEKLFGAGQPLDAAKFFIILPDPIGAGGSPKGPDAPRKTSTSS